MLSAFTHDHDDERLSCVSSDGAPADGSVATAVLLHGAGNGSKERLLPLLGEFAARGCAGLAFDFSGHGESTGTLGELSLRLRFEQAVSVIDATVPADAPLILVGFSMSGQTAADLVRHYGKRAVALVLCAPAVYAAEAWPLPFEDPESTPRQDGAAAQSRFSGILRTPDSWRRTSALDVLRAYEGRAVLVVPATDAVIPPAVTQAVAEALGARADFTRLELPDADHFLGLWFRDHADDRRRLVDLALTGLGTPADGSTAVRPAAPANEPAGAHQAGAVPEAEGA
ncbi:MULTISPECIES: alpha/beta fold hydrolase [unclassified Streptomyces]|uniref:alpha/beta hydrolase n=1 Tax=unclassified Streptomyces TaxID=2593676 RepID=UPI00343269D9